MLGIRRELSGSITGWHVEVQASINPIGYITKNKILRYVGHRTEVEVEECVRYWVHKKFRAEDKVQIRQRLWTGIDWKFHLVYATLKYPEELEAFRRENVECHPFVELLEELTHPAKDTYSCSAGGDLAEIVGYYRSGKQSSKV